MYMSRVYNETTPDFAQHFTSKDITNLDALLLSLIKLHVLAMYLQDLQTANMTVDSIIHVTRASKQAPSGKVTPLVYELTPDSSRLRKVLHDCFLHCTFPNTPKASVKHLPIDLLGDVLFEVANIVNHPSHVKIRNAFSRALADRARCHYHQHDESLPRCAGSTGDLE